MFEKDWADLVAEIKNNIYSDPKSAIGILLGEKCIMLINKLYGKKYANLRTTKILEKGFGEGIGLKEHGLTPEIVSWLDDATNAYYRDRISEILKQIGKISDDTLLNLWNDVLDDMYGNEIERKKQIYTLILNDQSVSNKAKEWLHNIYKC